MTEHEQPFKAKHGNAHGTKWAWSGFSATRMDNTTGEVEEKRFSSEAQARQFVERENGDGPLATRNITPKRPHELRRSGGGRVRTPGSLTPEQDKLRREALRQFVGL